MTTRNHLFRSAALMALALTFDACGPSTTDQQLALAAEIRHAYRDNDVPVWVVATHESLTVTFRAALFRYAPVSFLVTQREQMIRRLRESGFQKVIVEAKDESGTLQRREFTMNEAADLAYRARLAKYVCANGKRPDDCDLWEKMSTE